MSFSFRLHGLTIIELLITITIIGTLAAVLLPTASGYFRNTRDTQRITDVGVLSRSVEIFYKDRARYPNTQSGCVHEGLSPKYIKNVPKAPKGDRNEGCGDNGRYGYGVSKDRSKYILVSIMEGERNGNYTGSIDGFTGADIGSGAFERSRNVNEKMGPYYIVSNGWDPKPDAPQVSEGSGSPPPPPSSEGGTGSGSPPPPPSSEGGTGSGSPPPPPSSEGGTGSGSPPPTSGPYTCSEWTVCSESGQQTRTCTCAYNTCTGDNAITQACTPPKIYEWKTGDYGVCSVTCGSGTQTRSVKCIEKGTQQEVGDEKCSTVGPKPENSKPCSGQSCVNYCTLDAELDCVLEY